MADTFKIVFVWLSILELVYICWFTKKIFWASQRTFTRLWRNIVRNQDSVTYIFPGLFEKGWETIACSFKMFSRLIPMLIPNVCCPPDLLNLENCYLKIMSFISFLIMHCSVWLSILRSDASKLLQRFLAFIH